MLRRMLKVDNWLDVAPLENMEEDHSFLFLKKKELKFLNFFFFWKQPKKYEPNAPSPKALFENFLLLFYFFFFFFLFFWNMTICTLSKSEEDEDGVKVMKIFLWWFFFFFGVEKPILWMRTTLVGSWCGLLDKSLLNSCKR